jgi:hypothetical protein
VVPGGGSAADFFRRADFSTTFRVAQNSAALLGANLIGATAGGFCEYLSMVNGTRSLTLLVLLAYAASFLLQYRGAPGHGHRERHRTKRGDRVSS